MYIPPPPYITPHTWHQKIRKGNGGYILDMDSHCPYLLSGETTFHLTSMLKFPIYYLEKPSHI